MKNICQKKIFLLFVKSTFLVAYLEIRNSKTHKGIPVKSLLRLFYASCL